MFWQRRFDIVKHWFYDDKHGVSLPRLFWLFFGKTCAMKAKPKIKKLEETNDYFMVRFFDFEHPLYYPKHFREHSLYQIIAEGFYEDDWHYYEIEETRVDPDDIVIDCGAAEGLFSLQVAGRCRYVYAIEPLPAFAESMKLTFAPFKNTEIIQVALGDEEATIRFAEKDIGSKISDSHEGIAVRVTTLDNLFLMKDIPITYIKADLEGSDFDMIKGATELIRKYSPKIAITTYHKEKDAEDIFALLKNINPNYQIKVKGIAEKGAPVMLHAWIEKPAIGLGMRG